jgi:hypothetical protein
MRTTHMAVNAPRRHVASGCLPNCVAVNMPHHQPPTRHVAMSPAGTTRVAVNAPRRRRLPTELRGGEHGDLKTKLHTVHVSSMVRHGM